MILCKYTMRFDYLINFTVFYWKCLVFDPFFVALSLSCSLKIARINRWFSSFDKSLKARLHSKNMIILHFIRLNSISWLYFLLILIFFSLFLPHPHTYFFYFRLEPEQRLPDMRCLSRFWCCSNTFFSLRSSLVDVSPVGSIQEFSILYQTIQEYLMCTSWLGLKTKWSGKLRTIRNKATAIYKIVNIIQDRFHAIFMRCVVCCFI